MNQVIASIEFDLQTKKKLNAESTKFIDIIKDEKTTKINPNQNQDKTNNNNTTATKWLEVQVEQKIDKTDEEIINLLKKIPVQLPNKFDFNKNNNQTNDSNNDYYIDPNDSLCLKRLKQWYNLYGGVRYWSYFLNPPSAIISFSNQVSIDKPITATPSTYPSVACTLPIFESYMNCILLTQSNNIESMKELMEWLTKAIQIAEGNAVHPAITIVTKLEKVE